MALQGRKILPAYNFLRATTYISTSPVSFAHAEECKRGRNAEATGGLRLNQPASSENVVRGLYGLYEMRLPWRVARGWSRWGCGVKREQHLGASAFYEAHTVTRVLSRCPPPLFLDIGIPLARHSFETLPALMVEAA